MSFSWIQIATGGLPRPSRFQQHFNHWNRTSGYWDIRHWISVHCTILSVHCTKDCYHLLLLHYEMWHSSNFINLALSMFIWFDVISQNWIFWVIHLYWYNVPRFGVLALFGTMYQFWYNVPKCRAGSVWYNVPKFCTGHLSVQCTVWDVTTLTHLNSESAKCVKFETFWLWCNPRTMCQQLFNQNWFSFFRPNHLLVQCTEMLVRYNVPTIVQPKLIFTFQTTPVVGTLYRNALYQILSDQFLINLAELHWVLGMYVEGGSGG